MSSDLILSSLREKNLTLSKFTIYSMRHLQYLATLSKSSVVHRLFQEGAGIKLNADWSNGETA